MSKNTEKAAFTVEVGARLRQAREARGLSLTQLAACFPQHGNGISAQSINMWEQGVRCPKLYQIAQLSAKLRTPLSKLVPKVKLESK